MNTRLTMSLRPGLFKHLLRVASVTGRMPVRNVMLLWATHTMGIRVGIGMLASSLMFLGQFSLFTKYVLF